MTSQLFFGYFAKVLSKRPETYNGVCITHFTKIIFI